MTILHVSCWFFWNMGDRKGKPSMYKTLRGMVEAGHDVHFLFPRRRVLATRVAQPGEIHQLRRLAIRFLHPFNNAGRIG